MRKVLNVGGNSKAIALPPHFAGWQHVMLDIDPKSDADVICDARKLSELPAAEYDAVYCSHNLEHYYRHEVARVLAGFVHVLKPEGFVHIRVPDIGELMRLVAAKKLDIDDQLYVSAAGPISVHDVLYGLGKEIASSGNDFFAHKTGFTVKALCETLAKSGFSVVYSACANLEVIAYAFRGKPGEFARGLLNLPAT
jgi:Methyltransferase domain